MLQKILIFGVVVGSNASLDAISTSEAPNSAHPVPALFEFAEFKERIDRRMRGSVKRGSLAYIEIQNPYDGDRPNSRDGGGSAGAAVHAALFEQISAAIGHDDVFCWHDGRFALLFSYSTGTRQTLIHLGRAIAKCVFNDQGAPIFLTPSIGYVDMRQASSSDDLLMKAETALTCAKSSLDIMPFPYSRKVDPRHPRGLSAKIAGLWSGAPQIFVLSIQLIISLVFGLGAPFVLYAVLDAFGIDISGGVYIGVVCVLVITATTIWIEGFLALKPTTPPQLPGSDYPAASVIIPAYLPNEADTIVETLNAFLRLDYPNTVQVIIAYNSPKQLPVEEELRAIAAAQVEGGPFTVEPICIAGSSSKAQNVNAVIGRVRGQFVGIFDADHHPRPDSLRRAWRWLSNGWDIVQGRCSIRNGGDTWVSRMIAIEFEQIYAVSHPGRARFHGFGIFGGSNGFWRTPVLHETRMRHAMLTEDIDSSIRAVEAGYQIAGDRDLVSEELAPTSLKQLLNQRLRWAQGWFQVSLQRIIPVLFSSKVTFRQKLGLVHLLVWRELFPWYSVQVLPILTYWVWAYGWRYIHWAVPVFVATTIYTISTGPAQILFAYLLADTPMRQKPWWFVQYIFMSMLFFSPFKDSLSRIAHIKEAMREQAWRVTPRSVAPKVSMTQLAKGSAVVLLLMIFGSEKSLADAVTDQARPGFSARYITPFLGGEVATIKNARLAAAEGHNAEAAKLFEQAINAVPARRKALLPEYANALLYADRTATAATIYREILSSDLSQSERADMTARLALALTWSNQYRAALQMYDTILAKSPADTGAAMHRARVLAWLGEHDAAVAALIRIPAQEWASGTLGFLGDEILIGAAREAARTNHNTRSASLFEQAIHHNASLRADLLREYADQLLYSDRAVSAIPLYREVLKNPSIADGARTDAEIGLARAFVQTGERNDAIKLYEAAIAQEPVGSRNYIAAHREAALTIARSDTPTKALDALTDYLKINASDSEAALRRAQLLSSLNRDDQSLQAYEAAHKSEPHNAAAARGVVDETVKLARAMAQKNENGASATFFAKAIALDGTLRKSLLREYADQLAFSGQAADAIPLYKEVLSDDKALLAQDRKRAMRGLADACVWANRPADALGTYTDLVASYPDDSSLKWTRLVFLARQAAQQDQNVDSAKYFSQAIAIDAVGSAKIEREYADQLSFGGQLDAAIASYRHYLDDANISSEERLNAQLNLVRSYDWAGRQAEGKALLTDLIAKHPLRTDLGWTLAVVSAHEASRQDKNEEAVARFEQALQLMPERRDVILREYADQLSFAGRSVKAIHLYQEVLDRPALSQADRVSAQKGLAQAYDWLGRQGEAKSVYNALIAKYPDDAILQWDLLVTSAHQAAKENRNGEAAIFLKQAINLLPTRRAIILEQYADSLTFSEHAKDAVPLYREIIARDRKPAEIQRDTLSLALALAWDGQLAEAAEQYKLVTAADPNNEEAQVGLARVMSWSGHQADAEVAYQHVLDKNPNNPDAQRGLAQVEDWQGHHRAAQVILNRRLLDAPNDLEALRLLAQSHIWMGRPDVASIELAEAIKRQKASSEAQTAKLSAIATSAVTKSSSNTPSKLDASLAPASLVTYAH